MSGHSRNRWTMNANESFPLAPSDALEAIAQLR